LKLHLEGMNRDASSQVDTPYKHLLGFQPMVSLSPYLGFSCFVGF
jgi:hypothetical protein